MNQFFYNIAKRKRKNIDRMTEQKKARKMMPCVAVYLGKTVQTARSEEKKNEQAQFSENVF